MEGTATFTGLDVRDRTPVVLYIWADDRDLGEGSLDVIVREFGASGEGGEEREIGQLMLRFAREVVGQVEPGS